VFYPWKRWNGSHRHSCHIFHGKFHCWGRDYYRTCQYSRFRYHRDLPKRLLSYPNDGHWPWDHACNQQNHRDSLQKRPQQEAMSAAWPWSDQEALEFETRFSKFKKIKILFNLTKKTTLTFRAPSTIMRASLRLRSIETECHWLSASLLDVSTVTVRGPEPAWYSNCSVSPPEIDTLM